MKRTLTLIFSFIFILSMVGCNNDSTSTNTQKDIASIYVYHSSFGFKAPQYRVDLENKSLWEFKSNDTPNSNPQADELINDDTGEFVLIAKLSEKKVNAFRKAVVRHGFMEWESEYVNENCFDGHQWGITITFTDKTEQKVRGSNAYPDTWKKVKKDFWKLTKVRILE